MGCASSKTTIDAAIAQAKSDHAELRARIERAPPKKASELERILGLKEALLPEFQLLEERKVPFVIPDSDGTFQYTYSNVTVFGRRTC